MRAVAVARFFKVASTPSFSYLLPGALQRGRYVLDIEATDAAGNRTSLVARHLEGRVLCPLRRRRRRGAGR